MQPPKKIRPLKDEKPSHFADRIGRFYSQTVTKQHKKVNGQFFTQPEIAYFMVGLVEQKKSSLKILDPGCGTSILSVALIESLAERNNLLCNIELVVFETDKGILPFTKVVLEYLKKWLRRFQIKFHSSIKTTDFIIENRHLFEKNDILFSETTTADFDVVISNPPYFKLPKEDKRRLIVKTIVGGQPNIYAIFMIIAAKLLKKGGELIFITPRSFTAGSYFRTFRNELFTELKIERIHLFGSRSETFNRDNILQEIIILKGKKKQPNFKNYSITLSHSKGIRDIECLVSRVFLASELINFESKEKIIHLPVTETENRVIQLFRSWPGSLKKYGIQISTGPVVSFRTKEFLYEKSEYQKAKLAPLYLLANTAKMKIIWPIEKKQKPQYIRLCDKTTSILLPNKNYIFLRRFSTKDDKSRLIASPYFRDKNRANFIGIENHLNYIYRPNGTLNTEEIYGLSALLNSNLFNTCFQTFNGSINVSATELREMPLPSIEIIRSIGRKIIIKNDFSQTAIDNTINNMLKYKQ